MGGGDEPPDRTGGGNGLYSQVAAPPGSLSATSVMTVGGGDANDVRMRSFAEIIASEKQQRNILEINLTKLSTSENNTVTKSKPLNFDDLAELVFDVLKIDHKLCAGFNYSTGRYDTREVKFNPGVDLSPYIVSNIVFKNHEVSTKKQMNNLSKMSFINVPCNITLQHLST